MPLYRSLVRGYEVAYQPIDGHLYATHRLADEWNVRHGIYQEISGTHRHHMDFNRRNNRPGNIERMRPSEHIRLHNAENYGDDFDPKEHGSAIREALLRRAQDPQWGAYFGRIQSDRAAGFWHGEKCQQIRRQLIESRKHPTDETRDAHRRAMFARDAGSIRGAAALLNCDRSVFRRFPDVVASFRGTAAYRNHKVTAVREVAGDHDVYCLTVPEAGNFALQSGVFVHNCGIIVNVTPLEPEWEGHVTLEFSNTTPLPAKIYANEGVAQMLFFESDEICETSYKDRGGKYQGQRGVTLPKT
jgi:dCTP deaminase